MSTLELDRLEADVALARERVAADVARLRSPAAVAGFKDDISHTLAETAQRAATDFKNRAAANPAAVLAIAAGLLWRFARHPPIASILVGVGLASLMRTSAGSPPSPVVTRTGEWLEAASEKASDLSEQAREFTAQVRESAAAAAARVTETTGRFAEQATQAAAHASEQVRETASRLSEHGARLSEQASEAVERMSDQAGDARERAAAQAERASAWTSEQAARAARSADRARAAAQQVFADGSARDGFLLAAAALAVGAAAYLAQRRDD
jgi:hypothetical protein